MTGFRKIAMLAAALLALAPAAAAAAPRAAEPLELLRGERLEQPRIWTAPSGEVFATAIGRDAGERVLLGLPRPADAAAFGPPQELSRRLDAPPLVAFDSLGAAFAAWSIGGKVDRVEVSSRPPGGPFAAPLEREGCGARASADVGPGGELALLCRGTVGPGPASYRVVLHTQPAVGSPELFAFNLDGGIESGEVKPRVEIGASGALLAAWSRRTTEGAVVRAMVGRVGEAPGQTVTLATGSADLELNDIAVLENGTVAVMVSFFERVVVYLKRPGDPFEEIVIDEPLLRGIEGHRLAVANGTLIATFAHVLPGGVPKLMYRERPPRGGFGPVEEVGPAGWQPGELLVAGGGAVYATLSVDRPEGISTYVTAKPAGGDFGPLQHLPDVFAPHFAVGRDGDLLALWTDPGADADRLLLGGLDSGEPPTLHALDVPATARVGESIRVSARASDGLAVGAVRWIFGDGATADGPAAEHVYAEPGPYDVAVTIVDRAGNERVGLRRIDVEPAPRPQPAPLPDSDAPAPAPGDDGPPPAAGPLAPAADRSAPRLRLRAPGRVRPGLLNRPGLPLRIATDEPARISIVVRHGRRTVATRRLAPAPGRTLVRLRLRRGLDRLHRLRIVATATDAAGNRSTAARGLTVR